jgi:DNA polymerase I
MATKPRLFLFDAYALIYRAYYAFINRPMINSKGMNTSATYGFTSTLADILKKEKPDYAAVAFDPPTPTFRHNMFTDYKANRLSTPEEIKNAVPVIKQIIQAFHIPVVEIDNYEADDVIGTLAKRAEREGFITYMVTPDKDYMQLVSEQIFILKPSRSGIEYELIGIPEVNRFFGVDQPQQVIDVLALWGDATDNIPGAPGIGEKTAKELIARYQSLENLLEHLHELKGRQKESLSVNRQQVMLSRNLARINTEVPVNISFGEFKIRPWDEKLLAEIFRNLEFRSLSNRLLKDDETSPVQGTLFDKPQEMNTKVDTKLSSISSISHQYHVVQHDSQLDELIENLLEKREFCFDTETTGLNTRSAELVGISFSYGAHEAYYIPVPSQFEQAMTLLNKLRPVFENPAIKKVGQNLKFDIQMLLNYQVFVKGELFDTMIAHYLIQPDFRHNLDYLSEIYLNYRMVPIEDLIGKKGDLQRNMRDVEIQLIKEYACEDADISWQLYQILSRELQERGLVPLAQTIEMPLVRVLAEIEYAGFRIDREVLKKYAETLRTDLQSIENEIYLMSELKFNINSPKQLGEVLFEKMKIADGTQKTKTKQYSTGEEVLLKLADKHPIVNRILDYRATQKLLSTYVDALPELIDRKTGRIHTSFDQAWVSTGRLSSRNPNLQNIPIRDERGREIRKAFVSGDEDHLLLSADYSQIELRIMAHLSQDPNMIEAFVKNADIHVSTAAKIYKIGEDEVTAAMRSQAKTANFGIIYGISSFGLSQRLSISRSDASALIQGYFESFPLVKAYMDNAIRIAKEKGYVETIMGRRRFLPDIHSANAVVRGVAERNAINAPIQGSAADIIKLAMVNIQEKLGRFKTRMILQVHDELIFDVWTAELEQVKALVKAEMEHVMKLRVPLTVEIGTGRNWLEAH